MMNREIGGLKYHKWTVQPDITLRRSFIGVSEVITAALAQAVIAFGVKSPQLHVYAPRLELGSAGTTQDVMHFSINPTPKFMKSFEGYVDMTSGI